MITKLYGYDDPAEAINDIVATIAESDSDHELMGRLFDESISGCREAQQSFFELLKKTKDALISEREMQFERLPKVTPFDVSEIEKALALLTAIRSPYGRSVDE